MSREDGYQLGGLDVAMREQSKVVLASNAAINNLRLFRTGNLLVPHAFQAARRIDYAFTNGLASRVLRQMNDNYLYYYGETRDVAIANLCLNYDDWEKMRGMKIETIGMLEQVLQMKEQYSGMTEFTHQRLANSLEEWKQLPPTPEELLVISFR